MSSRSIAGVEVGESVPVRIMAVLNVSPESFYRGSVSAGRVAIRDRARRYVDEGADFIDIGAMSTAPYLETRIEEDEERRRMVGAVETVAGAVSVPISADTSRSGVASAALEAGAAIVNDVRGLRGDGMCEVAATAQAVILMASPRDEVRRRPLDPIEIVTADLRAATERASAGGVRADRIVLDPGVGFYVHTGWSAVEFNSTVLRRLAELGALGFPLLVGISRKSFIAALTERKEPGERLAGSLAATAIAVRNGASIVRTHDVAATLDAVRVARALG